MKQFKKNPSQNIIQPANPIFELRSILARIELQDLFATPQPLEVELGSGDGTFLRDHALKHPERNFIGVERLLGRLRKIGRKARAASLTNVRAVRIESAYFLEYLMPPQTIEALHIYFPDPWPKKKHRRHRLINERFPSLARKTLLPGGVVYLRTDDLDYFEQMELVFSTDEAFTRTETPLELSARSTDFERGFNEQGIRTLRAAYRRTDG